MLSLAGKEPPAWMQGRAFAGPHIAPANEYLHGFRGRMDERYDSQRSVTDGQYVYLRNYMPHLPAGQHVEYMFQTKTTRIWKTQYEQGKLNEAQSRFWKALREAEELYDLRTDPDEVTNLAGARTSDDAVAAPQGPARSTLCGSAMWASCRKTRSTVAPRRELPMSWAMT